MASEFTAILGRNMKLILWDILKTLVLILWQYWFQQISQHEIDSHCKYTIISILLVPNIIYIYIYIYIKAHSWSSWWLHWITPAMPSGILGSNFSSMSNMTTGFCGSLVPPKKYCSSTSNQMATASFHINSNSLFIQQLIC